MAPSTQFLLAIGMMLCGTTLLVEGVDPAADNFQQEMVAGHNTFRKTMGLGPLTWNATLAAYAENYAKQRAGDCQMAHSHGPYGENLFWGKGSTVENGATAVRLWIEEKADYDYASNACINGKQCKHYTQIVWRNTQRLGCAHIACSTKGGFYVVCSYDPPGNYVGDKPY